jgi:5'-AMP-activated protein kinase, catalytic alpha subunit
MSDYQNNNPTKAGTKTNRKAQDKPSEAAASTKRATSPA